MGESMKRLISNLIVVGFAVLLLAPGRAAAQHKGGFGGYRPGPAVPGGSSTHRSGFTPYHPSAMPAATYHTPQPQYAMPSNHAPAYTGSTVTVSTSSQNFGPVRAGPSGSAGTTVSLKQLSLNGTSASLASRPATAGTTVSLQRRPTELGVSTTAGTKLSTALGKLQGARPTELSNLPRPQQNGLNRIQTMLNNGTLRIPGNALALIGDPTGAITTYLNTPAGSSLPPAAQDLLGDIASGQPLSPLQIAVAVSMVDSGGLPPDVSAAVAQGVVDNVVNNNSGQVANNNSGQAGNNTQGQSGNNSTASGIVGTIAQVLQNLASGGGSSGSGSPGGSVASGSDAGSVAGSDVGSVMAAAPVGAAGVVDVPIVQDSSITQPVTSSVTGGQAVRQFRRYLQVKNDSNAKLKVYVQYSAHMDDGSFQWFPTRPGGDQAVGFTLAPGATAAVDHDGWRVKADRVRIWAVAADGTAVTDYRDQDLWLVAEQNGERAYYAPDLEVFTFTFGR
jgi:hypothetical protein